MSIIFQRAFWLNLAGMSVAAIVATAPILMSGVMDRGYEIAKQSVAEPLAVLALGAVLLAGGWKWLLQQGMPAKIAAGSLLVFLLLAAVSTALSENPEVAVFGGYYRREGLLAWGIYSAFFFAMLGWARKLGRAAGFLDVLLLASVIPAAYALQQRLDLDFYPLGLRDFTRPGGTMGSPLFLAAYLGLLLPITTVRCWQARRALPELALWLTVAALQACGLLVTQTRGPLFALFMGMLMLACFAAGYARARRFFLVAAVVFSAAVAALAAMNTLDSARHWAQDVPVVRRLVFDLDREAGAETRRASTSAAVRLAIWEAGVRTFAAAPLESKLLGYGPESAYMHYFQYMPPSVMRLAGYGHYNTYDRLHADTLDIGLNFGLLAWLVYCLFFGSVIYAAARALFGLSGFAPPWIFLALMFSGGSSASIAAGQAGLASAAVPAFGLGMGAGWFLFMVGGAWRLVKIGAPATMETQTDSRVLLAGLVSALLVFWTDAQVNIPVLTTRLISFAIAALILVVADKIVRNEQTDDVVSQLSRGIDIRVWGAACALVAACASCLPITLFDASMGNQTEGHWGLRALPILFFLTIAVWAQTCRGMVNAGAARLWLAVTVGLPSLYIAVHYMLMVTPDSELSLQRVQAISIGSFAGPAFIFAMSIAFALLASRSADTRKDPAAVSRLARWAIGGVVALVLLVVALDWRAIRADVASTLAAQASSQQAHSGDEILEEAIRLLPHERFYRRQLVYERLRRAVADIRTLNAERERTARSADRIAAVVRNLNAAERAARTASQLFPRDPWIAGALANVLQFEALRVLRPLDPEGGMRSALEANRIFARTHEMFPSEPLFLRNWAQLLYDQGNLPDAYRLLDVMEKLIPNDPEPYSARIDIAVQDIDNETISLTLARARRALAPQVYGELLAAAKAREN